MARKVARRMVSAGRFINIVLTCFGADLRGDCTYLVTTTVHVADLPSIVTVTAVVPALRAVTRPVVDTDATPVDLDLYVAAVLLAFEGAMTGLS